MFAGAFAFFDFAHEFFDFGAGHAEGGFFVAEDGFGGGFDVFAELFDALAGGAFVFGGFGEAVEAGEAAGGFEVFLDFLCFGFADGVVEFAAEDGFSFFGLLAEILEIFEEFFELGFLGLEILLDG